METRIFQPSIGTVDQYGLQASQWDERLQSALADPYVAFIGGSGIPAYLRTGTCPNFHNHEISMTEGSGLGEPISRMFEDLHAKSIWDIPPLYPKNVRRVRAIVRNRTKAKPLPFSIDDD